MHIPKQLSLISGRINSGRRVHRVTVRDLLRMFGAERRGQHKVQEIRDALSALCLETSPDFESVWIDGYVRIVPLTARGVADESVGSEGCPDRETDVLTDDDSYEEASEERQYDEEESPQLTEVADGEVAGAEGPTSAGQTQPAIEVLSDEVEQIATTKASDPTFRIGSLPAANAGVTMVSRDDLITTAITKMLQFDFSQLPIMQGDRVVKGVISWKSVASLRISHQQGEFVRDCSEVAQVIDASGTLFDAVPTIAKHGYVLVKDPQSNRITGIVTSSDLNLHFQQLTEPFLLLREIELSIRELLKSRLTADDLKLIELESPKPVPISQIAGLSFGHYIRLFQRSDIWVKLNLKIDQKSVVSQLDEVREIRNDVMHFSPDPMEPNQREALKNASSFMQTIFKLFIA
jgi:predicted transcriptional regulator